MDRPWSRHSFRFPEARPQFTPQGQQVQVTGVTQTGLAVQDWLRHRAERSISMFLTRHTVRITKTQARQITALLASSRTRWATTTTFCFASTVRFRDGGCHLIQPE